LDLVSLVLLGLAEDDTTLSTHSNSSVARSPLGASQGTCTSFLQDV